MPNSLHFNDIDMSAYGLVVKSANLPDLSKKIDTGQLIDRSYCGVAKRPPRNLNVQVKVYGNGETDIYGKLDVIKRHLDNKGQLVFDALPDRYFNAQTTGIKEGRVTPAAWEGTITFLCADPLAYAINSTSSNFNIDADPDTVIEAVGGSGLVKPVYTLTAGEDLGSITVILENETTGEELQWTGSLSNTDVLTIDVEYWIVKVNGTALMSGLSSSSQFPRLQHGNNSIKVTNFSNTGTLNIVYRNAYL